MGPACVLTAAAVSRQWPGGLRKVPGDFPLGFAAFAALVSERPGRAGAVGVEEDIR